MTHPAFEHLRHESIASLKIEYHEYAHRNTGARHIHLNSDDDNNAFLVAFRTVPQDSTGVAHILEHTSLCGSEKFPVRDPFFMMTRRSLSTFMNAFTASDWTAYPFATQSRKDFDNLLQVYLDATFFPNLDELDFLQEGCRLDLEDDDTLTFKGIVFNEMKGAMSAPVQRIWQDLQSALFPTTTYHYNSGGEPENIPDLTHQQLRDFHAQHYHPSNALFMTYGNFPVEEHHARIEELVLQHFSRQSMDVGIGAEQRYTEPQVASTRFGAEDGDETPRAQVVVSWLLGPVQDTDATMDAHMLSSALLDNSASPLRHALETSDLGTAPSELCGFEDSMAEGVFACGLEGCSADDAEAIQTMILSVLEDVAANGVPQSQLEAILHQIELSQREVGGGQFPYGLQLMVKSLAPALHGADPMSILDVEPLLERLRDKVADPRYIPELVQSLLLDNPHRVLLTARPDATLAKALESQEDARLADIAASLTDADKAGIRDKNAALEARQAQADDPSVLPSVAVSDAPKSLNYPESEQFNEQGHPISFFATPTNGLVYQQLVVQVPDLAPEYASDLPLFCDVVNDVGIRDLDYRQTQTLQASVSGGIRARLSYRSPLGDLQGLNTYFVLSGKALLRNQDSFAELLRDTFQSARLDELDRLRELIAQSRAHREAGVTQAGHSLAMLAASAGTSPYASLAQHWSGLSGISRLIALDKQLQDDDALAALAERLRHIQTQLLNAPRQFLVINETQNLPVVKESLASLWPDAPGGTDSQPLRVDFTPQQIAQGWTTSTQVNFCAKSYATVASNHPDAAALTVLGHFMRNGFLHGNIREKGGAYGGGASYAPDSGTFRFYSYRDPRFADTLDDFDRCLDWLQSSQHEARQVEEAILGVISNIDRPESPAGEAVLTWFAALHGRGVQERKAFRERMMAVGLDDLRRVASTWIKPEHAHTAVITDNASLDQYNQARPDNALEAIALKGG